MDEEKRLKGASSWQYKPRHTESCLGDEVCSFLEQRNRAFVVGHVEDIQLNSPINFISQLLTVLEPEIEGLTSTVSKR